MLDHTLTLPDDPEDLRSFTAGLLAEVKAQMLLSEQLRHQLTGHRADQLGRRPRRQNSCSRRSRPVRSPPPR